MERLEWLIIAALASVIAYFLKVLHAEIQTIRQKLHTIETVLAVSGRVEEDRERRLLALEDLLFKKGA
jgi:hypothetical protein